MIDGKVTWKCSLADALQGSMHSNLVLFVEKLISTEGNHQGGMFYDVDLAHALVSLSWHRLTGVNAA